MAPPLLLSPVGSSGEGAGASLLSPSGGPGERPGTVPTPTSCRSGSCALLSPRRSTLHGVALTVKDIVEQTDDDARDNHERSQELLRAILQHRGLQVSNKAPFVKGVQERGFETEEHRRQDFNRRIFDRLRERGLHGIRSFRRMLHHMDQNGDGLVSGRTFEGALAHMGVRLKGPEFRQMLELFGNEDTEMVNYMKFLAYGCSNWSPQREEVVKEAYDVLRAMCPGHMLSTALLERQFRPQAIATGLIPYLLEHEGQQEFLTQWSDSNLAPDGHLRWHDFLDYYHDASLFFSSDQDFCQFVCKSWGIDADDWLAKKIFRKYASAEDENSLECPDFVRMLHELDPTITEDEALAWFVAIDDDQSGEVSLDEFLSSKVLKVKRLFDQFDEENMRTVGKDVMVQILRHLSEDISQAEAEAVYQYADLDNNGEVSFAEFLENNLLKLLQIFQEFDTSRSRSFSEADMKKLLKRMDPFLLDDDIQQVYKAIDVDGSGTISFIEFCESHVLRAKAVFDRYDTDKSRALTQFKFRELLLDLDKDLTPAQQEAIYQLVVDPNTNKVHLGGFLNPNILKLKMLFDKYDQERRRYLDADKFKCMLKDMYNDATDKDVEEILQTIYPGEEQGISFTSYIQRFKEISRKHDLIQLAKRRAARMKAKARA